MKNHKFGLGVLLGLFSAVALAAYIPYAITSGANKERLERATFTNSGSCAVSSQSGSWITGVSDPGAGRCGITMAGFSAIPTCTVSPVVSTSDRDAWCGVIPTSPTALEVGCRNTAGGTLDIGFHLICMGPR